VIGTDTIREVLATYKKHGWLLRRVLLSPGLKAQTGDETETLFPDVEVKDSDLDAVWFSRQSRKDSVAWELRRLGPLPFALVEVVDAELPPEDLESVLSDAEERLRQSGLKLRT
jgi:hypothetical protein